MSWRIFLEIIFPTILSRLVHDYEVSRRLSFNFLILSSYATRKVQSDAAIRTTNCNHRIGIRKPFVSQEQRGHCTSIDSDSQRDAVRPFSVNEYSTTYCFRKCCVSPLEPACFQFSTQRKRNLPRMAWT
jgi:hypothetical protein